MKRGDGGGWRPGWWDVAGLGLLLVGMALVARRYWGFTLDDAYITLRFSRNLATGHGLAWNPGGSPTEGYTTTLWVLVNALFLLVGLDGILVAKTLGLASLGALVVGLYVWGRREGVDPRLLVAILAGLAWSPAIVLLAVQGMETATAMLLVFLTSIATVAYVREPRAGPLAGLLAANVLLVLVRPGLALFAAALVVGVTGVLHGTGEGDRARRFFTKAVVWNLIPALGYVGLRYLYFGDIAPTPVYVKGADGIVSVRSLEHLYFLGAVVLGPGLVLGLASAFGSRKRVWTSEARAWLPLVFAVGVLFAALAFVNPVQGFFARYHVPAAAAILVPLLAVARTIELPSSRGIRLWDVEVPVRRWAAVGVLLLVLGAPLQTLADADFIVEQKHPGDRIAVGKALSDHEPRQHRILLTEAGAISYYSDWRSADNYGLTNTTIAEHGLEPATIEAFDPHVVQSKSPARMSQRHPAIASFLDGSSHELAAAVEKSRASTDLHLYFVDTEKDNAEAIACTLLTIEELTYADRAEVVEQIDGDVRVGPWNSEECAS